MITFPVFYLYRYISCQDRINVISTGSSRKFHQANIIFSFIMRATQC
jgi:hypothetical protein